MPQVQTKYFPFVGGLDQVTPPIEVGSGVMRYGSNFEIGTRGGYTRVPGYERYSGQAKPSAATYAVLPTNSTAGVTVGATITNDAGTSTAKVIALDAAGVIVTQQVGVILAGNLRIGGLVVAVATGAQMVNGASTPKLHAKYRNLAADAYRALIGPVPGSGRVLGVHQYNGKVYAFRNNAAGTAAVMHVATPSGWSAVPLGRELKFRQRSSTVTITIAAPGVITWNGHGMAAGQQVTFSTTGALPTGLTTGVTYYVLAPTPNTFTLAATSGGAAITTTGTQSGAHTGYLTAFEVVDGVTITGATSGATAVVKRSVLSNGTWTSTPTGSLVFASVTGAFTVGEALTVGGLTVLSVAVADVAITLLPNGRYQFDNHNFGGQLVTLRMYGCDGVNRGFEFDGTTFVPITTSLLIDAPTNVIIHKNQLFYSFASSLQHSGIGAPYTFAPIFGAAELACGDTVTGMLVVPGSDGGGAMAVFTQNSTSVLYGDNSDNWNLVKVNKEAGAYAYTMQYVLDGIVLDAQGITTLQKTQRFGNFQSAAISDLVAPYLSDKIPLASASCTVRKKNQYRLFFSTGEAVYVTFSGDKILGIAPIFMVDPVACISSAEGASGLEEVYFGSNDGFVYQMEVGTSFDGENIDANVLLSFNHFGGPRQLKRFRKTAIDVAAVGYAEFNFSTSLAYGSQEFAQSAISALQPGSSSAAFWDQFIWDQFYWDGQALSPAEADTVGTAENISLIFTSSSDEYDPFTLNSAVMHFSPLRLLR
jgi:hypothetical protein